MLDSIHQNENGVQGALQQLDVRIAELLLPQPFMKIEDLLGGGFQQLGFILHGAPPGIDDVESLLAGDIQARPSSRG